MAEFPTPFLSLALELTTTGGGIAKTRINSVAQSIATSSGSALIQFSGVTGYQYDVQRTTSLNPPLVQR